MRKYFFRMLFLFLCSFSLLSAYSPNSSQNAPYLYTGVYTMVGSNPGSERINYEGNVIIDAYGANYIVTWIINNRQTQVGIGILNDHILSVAFYDGKNTGVVSFSLTSPGELEGTWAEYNSGTYGREWLTLQSP